MRKITILLLSISWYLPATSQSSLQIAIDAGPTITPGISYRNCTGHINPVLTTSFALIYKPDPSFGLELKFSSLLNPVSYLNNDSDYTLKTYTTSHIFLQHLVMGFNYYLPFRPIHPYLGLLLGASYAETKDISPQSKNYNLSWGFQSGATLDLSNTVALKFGGYILITPGVYNNTSYFNAGADGSGFPSFIIGNPSKATITQWNINLGLAINLKKRGR